MTRAEILAAITDEREEQKISWKKHAWGFGDCSSPDVPMIVKAVVLGEEVGEVMQAILDAGPEKSRHDALVRYELVQVAAVAWAILEGM